MRLKFHREPDVNGDSGGAPASVAPAAPAAATADAPPAAPSQLELRLAQLEQTNTQLQQQLAYTQQVALRAGVPMQAQPQQEQLDLSQLDPTLVKLLDQRQAQVNQTLDQKLAELRDLTDSVAFQQATQKVNAPAEAVAQADATFAAWKQNGTMIRNGNGQLVPPSRKDALVFAMGQLALEGKLPAQGKAAPAAPAPAANPNVLGERPGASGALPTGKDPATMTREERIAMHDQLYGDTPF